MHATKWHVRVRKIRTRAVLSLPFLWHSLPSAHPAPQCPAPLAGVGPHRQTADAQDEDEKLKTTRPRWVGLTLGSNGGSADDAEKAGWERKMLNKRDRASESERASERARESGERDFIRNNAHGGSWARSSDRRCITLCAYVGGTNIVYSIGGSRSELEVAHTTDSGTLSTSEERR